MSVHACESLPPTPLLSLSPPVILICGFVTLLPLPSLTAGFGLGGYGRCVTVGLVMM